MQLFPFFERASLEKTVTLNTASPYAVPCSNVIKVMTILTSCLKFEYLQKNKSDFRLSSLCI